MDGRVSYLKTRPSNSLNMRPSHAHLYQRWDFQKESVADREQKVKSNQS